MNKNEYLCEDCNKRFIKNRNTKNKYNKHLCHSCYVKRQARKGELRRTRYDNQVIEIKDDYAEIILCDIHGEEKARAIVDLDVIDDIKKHKWYLGDVGYPVSKINGKLIRLHRFLIKSEDTETVIDHINGNKLDNRYKNLQICSSSLNVQKSKHEIGISGIYGVCKNHNNWMANIKFQNKRYNKTFKTLEEAIIQRLRWEIQFLGEFAPNMDLINNQYRYLLNEDNGGGIEYD